MKIKSVARMLLLGLITLQSHSSYAEEADLERIPWGTMVFKTVACVIEVPASYGYPSQRFRTSYRSRRRETSEQIAKERAAKICREILHGRGDYYSKCRVLGCNLVD